MSAPSVLTGEDFHFKYTVQKGFFAQSEEETDDAGFDFVCWIRIFLDTDKHLPLAGDTGKQKNAMLTAHDLENLKLRPHKPDLPHNIKNRLARSRKLHGHAFQKCEKRRKL
jgi:hypothetical protein